MATPMEAHRRSRLLVERRAPMLIIHINRPAANNALDRSAYYDIIRALNEAAHDDEVSMVVLTGVGDTFSAGKDATQTHQWGQLDAQQLQNTTNYVLRAIVRAFLHCPKVLVALVNGPCVGIGFTLCALCDIVYCTETAYFQAPFVRYGLCPEACASHRLPLTLGRAKAMELLLFGKKLTAMEAVQYNFVAGVYASQQLDAQFWPQLMEYAKLPGTALRITKKLLTAPEREACLRAMDAECAQLDKLRTNAMPSFAIKTHTSTSYRNKSKL